MAIWTAEDYIRLMRFEAIERPMFVELFGPIVGLEAEWRAQGASPEELSLDAFGFDWLDAIHLPVDLGPWSGIQPHIIHEDEDEQLSIDAYGRRMRLVRHSATIPLPLDHPVATGDDWRRIRHWFRYEPGRLDRSRLEAMRRRQTAGGLIIFGLPGAFDLPRQLIGEEALCYLYYDEPELIADILETVGDLALRLLDEVSREIRVDCLHIHEDMAGKSGPLIGPDLVASMMAPYYRRLWQLAASRGARLFSQDSDGDMSCLVGAFADAGVNVMYPCEPASGMDIVALRARWGERMAFKGGLDKHVLRQGYEAIDRELDYKLQPQMWRGCASPSTTASPTAAPSTPTATMSRGHGGASASPTTTAAPGAAWPSRRQTTMRRWSERLIARHDRQIPSLMARQCLDEASPDYGAFLWEPYGLADPIFSLGQGCGLIHAYATPGSAWTLDRELERRIGLMLDHLGRVMRPDGNLDSMQTNFDSAPDVAFAMQGLGMATGLVRRFLPSDEGARALLARLEALIQRLAAGMRSGGFHTPNHRWVIAAALAIAQQFCPDEANLDYIDRLFAEGIDQDEDGEYTERSMGCYNAITNRALIYCAHLLQRPALLEHVRRNLELCWQHTRPDGGLFSCNSLRQDRRLGIGDAPNYGAEFIDVLLYMWALTGDEEAHLRLALLLDPDRPPFDAAPPLGPLLLWPRLQQLLADLPSGAELDRLATRALPRRFTRHFARSGLLLHRHDDFYAAYMSEHEDFLHVYQGELGIACASPPPSTPSALQRSGGRGGRDGGWTRHRAEGRYLMPLDDAADSVYWEDLPHHLRRRVNEMALDSFAVLRPDAGRLSLDLSVSGYDRVPMKVELLLPPGCRVVGDGFALDSSPGANLSVKGGELRIIRGADELRITGLSATHRYTAAMRGGPAPEPGLFTVYATALTPWSGRIEITGHGPGGLPAR